MAPPAEPVFRCSHCRFVLFFNPAVAGAAFLRNPAGELLFLRRAHEPAQGKLGLPGGFVDYHETAEQGLAREIREEIGIDAGPFTFLCTQVNRYEYQDTVYPVVDLFFTSDLPVDAQPRCLDAVDDLRWLRPEDVDVNSLAFPSLRAAFQHLMTLDIST
jgi:8-oxo-dGTP pyrophosphatase MutT (NUDIX family)